MDIKEKLKEIGLNSSEVRVYLWLLENGIATPPKVAIGTGIARANCYHVLEELKASGLINEQAQGKRKAYVARDPQALLLSVEQKKEAIEELLPDLRGLFVQQKNKPKIQFYEKWEEVQQIYWQTLSAEKIVAIGSIKKLEELDAKFFLKYRKEVEKRKIIFRDILSGSATDKVHQETKQVIGVLYDARLLPVGRRDNPTDILVWGDNIAFITLGEPIFGTVLTNPSLAQALKTIFEVLWERL